jgi:hypothetical protein
VSSYPRSGYGDMENDEILTLKKTEEKLQELEKDGKDSVPIPKHLKDKLK